MSGIRVLIVGFNPQIYTRDTRLAIPPHVMASSVMGLNLGVFGLLPTTDAKANAKQMCLKSLCAVQHRCLHVHTAVHACNTRTWRTTFWLWKNPKTPKLSPMQGSRWRRFWLSLVYICDSVRLGHWKKTCHDYLYMGSTKYVWEP